MRKTLLALAAALSMSSTNCRLEDILPDCKPKGAIGYESRDIKDRCYCDCDLLHDQFDIMSGECEGKFSDIMNHAFRLGYCADIQRLEGRFGKGNITSIDENTRKIEYDGLVAEEGCCCDGKPFITRFEITSPNFVLQYGIRVGLTRDKVMSKLEEPNLRCPDQDVYDCEAGGAESQLIIKYYDGIVSKIVINHWTD
jgi:hypothetical protein